jgi:hypothetical protein
MARQARGEPIERSFEAAQRSACDGRTSRPRFTSSRACVGPTWRSIPGAALAEYIAPAPPPRGGMAYLDEVSPTHFGRCPIAHARIRLCVDPRCRRSRSVGFETRTRHLRRNSPHSSLAASRSGCRFLHSLTGYSLMGWRTILRGVSSTRLGSPT